MSGFCQDVDESADGGVDVQFGVGGIEGEKPIGGGVEEGKLLECREGDHHQVGTIAVHLTQLFHLAGKVALLQNLLPLRIVLHQ